MNLIELNEIISRVLHILRVYYPRSESLLYEFFLFILFLVLTRTWT